MIAALADPWGTAVAAALVVAAAWYLVARLRRTFARRGGCGCPESGTPGCAAASAIARIRRETRKAARSAR